VEAFREQIKQSTAHRNELVEVVLGVLRDQNASNRERMEAATWLADRGFGKPTVNAVSQAPGIGDFTIVIGDHDARVLSELSAPIETRST
jgi:hydroxylamine reductase (hybrid-cluster protein)